MRLALIIIHYGSLTMTEHCLRELKNKIVTHRLILVNNSPDDISRLTQIIPDTVLIDNRRNVGFSRAVNQGIELAQSDASIDAYLLLNNDLEFTFGSLDRLAKTFIDKPSAGIVSPVLHHSSMYDWGGRLNRWTGMVRHLNFAQKPKTVLTVGHVAGAAMLIHKSVISKIGVFDTRFFLYFEDLDFCLRARQAGFTIHVSPDVVAEHATSAASRPLRRLLYQWHSHLQFVTKHLFRLVYPTAYLYDFIFYPLALLKYIFTNRKS